MKSVFHHLALVACLGLLATSAAAQIPAFYRDYTFTTADTLRGALRPERTCYDVTYYGLHLRIDPRKQQLQGYVDIDFTAVANFSRLQIDLYDNMQIDGITFADVPLEWERDYQAIFVNFPETVPAGTRGTLRVTYHGEPQTARMPPWDGGFVWTQDRQGRSWSAVACEGDGASLWLPNKDHLSDEPDSVLISVAVPKDLMCVANGNLREVEDEGAFTRYNWFVSYPINNYNVSVNIGHYAHFSDEYYAQDGDTLALDYYVLDYNEARAREHFTQTKTVLAAYEHYLDKYPFWEDGFALIETPYLGMEHQSGIAYGNKYMRGYLGGMIPRGMNWDYIIVHESGHEYFGNSISCNDLAEMWIHESFTTYLESLYVEYTMGYKDAVRYLVSQRSSILNQEPILGPANVNWEDWQGSDHYFKGSWMLHTL
ncbi:MAG: M1 family metallopeptidase, partial [Lewinella sp.]|nr:M1 family metallopeptidase [Lewinella sp.]